MKAKLLSLAAAACLFTASTAIGYAQSSTDQSTSMRGAGTTGHETGTGQEVDKNVRRDDVGKGVRDTHSSGQDIKQQRGDRDDMSRPGMGMSTEGTDASRK